MYSNFPSSLIDGKKGTNQRLVNVGIFICCRFNFEELDKTDLGIIKSAPTEANEDDSDQFSVDLTTNSMYIFLDDDEGPTNLSFGEAEKPHVPVSHVQEKWLLNLNDHSDDFSCCKYCLLFFFIFYS